MALLGGLLALILTSCPANRDGMPGQLATAKQETQSAVRSAALALQLSADRRSTSALASVQLVDMRDQIVKAYKKIASLRADNDTDLKHQRVLTTAMTAFIDDLNAASAAVRGASRPVDLQPLRQRLLDGADALDRDYDR
ncbi:hypothetical protein [Mycolicibacterium pallens]|uniref:Lipoprotein n=1 Tax=Mycolicibacterium pallens TaxID=370524 RepID=A0ABX8VKV7_9MYCO|nr:hypothetical protein [Mycolicibacterium pallens]QYL18434.1 hypothetical protein K0O64_07975 [Mycolicibacterium pallens]